MDLMNELKSTGALLTGHFILSSGLHSGGYIQCAKLLQYPELASEAGRGIARRIRTFLPDKVVSPAIGGLIIGQEVSRALGKPHVFVEKKNSVPMLRRGFEIQKGEKIVIIEDVVTTGLSVIETAKVVEEFGGEIVAIASIINRSGKENPFEKYRYIYLEKIQFDTYEAKDCPLCADGIEAVKPGSRK